MYSWNISSAKAPGSVTYHRKGVYRQERSCRILNMCQKTHVRPTEKAIEMNLPAKYQYNFLLHQHAVQNYVAE